jgi:DNA-binding response OmpR family regulator
MSSPEADDAPAVILVVDDNAASRYIVGSWLSRSGHTVIEAVDGAQGLAAFAPGGGARSADGTGTDTRPPELAIVDVRLPDMSGFEVCERIKARPGTAGVPVIHISAVAVATADRAQGLSRGADAYLSEPIAPTELLATVTAALRYARARRRAEQLAERLSALNQATVEVYGAPEEESLAEATARGAARLMNCEATVLIEPVEAGPIRVTAAGPDGATRSRLVPPGLLQDLSRHILGERVGAEIARLPPELWAEYLAASALEGDVILVLARAKADRPAVGIAVDATAAASAQDHQLAAQLAHACALVLESLR